MPLKTQKAVVLRPFYHKGKQYKSGDTATLTEREFEILSGRSSPIVRGAGEVSRKQSYETKTPQQGPQVEATGAGWYSVKIGEQTHKVRGEEALNELLESNA